MKEALQYVTKATAQHAIQHFIIEVCGKGSWSLDTYFSPISIDLVRKIYYLAAAKLALKE